MGTLQKIVHFLLKSRFKNYVPRWVILFFDLVIVISSYSLLWVFRQSVGHNQGGFFMLKLCIITGLYILSSYVYKTYHGVVRFTSLNDLRRLGYSSIFVLIIYEAVSVVSNLYIVDHLHEIYPDVMPRFNYWVPPILIAIIFTFQILFRFIIRAVFEYFKLGAYTDSIQINEGGDKKKRVFILGSDYDSLLLTSSILADANSIFEPVGFVTFNGADIGKRLGNLPIVNGSNGLRKYAQSFNAETLLIYRSQIKTSPKEFFDNCIADSIEILVVNSFHKFEDDDKESVVPRVDKIKIDDLLWRDVIYLEKSKFSNCYANKVIMITGGAGSIGSELVRQLCSLNCSKIVIVDAAESPMFDLMFELNRFCNANNVIPFVGDVVNRKVMDSLFKEHRPDVVFHAAAYKHVPLMELQPSTAILNNIGGSKTIADICVKYNVSKFVMVSTDKAVNPTNVMGATKRAAEIYIQTLNTKLKREGNENSTRFITTRFGNVLGSNGSVVPLFKKQIEKGGPVTVTHKDITRYFMTIPEACSLVLEAGAVGEGGEIFVFDMGEAVKIYDLAEKMIRLAGKKPHKDIKIVETGLRPGEKLYEELLANSENTIPTENKKIMRAKVREYNYEDICPQINALINASQYTELGLTSVKLLKKLIPEYLSHNSVYEKLD